MLLTAISFHRGLYQAAFDQICLHTRDFVKNVDNVKAGAFSTLLSLQNSYKKDCHSLLLNSPLSFYLVDNGNTKIQHLTRFQVRLFGTNIRAPIPEKEFFNRTRELAAFRRVLEGIPQISIISGPVNSGKTSLILLLLEQMSRDARTPRPILHLDLRERSFSSVQELSECFEEAMVSWADRFQEVVSQIKITGIGKFKFDRVVSGGQSPIVKLNKTFSVMSKHLPEYRCFIW